MEDKIFPFVSRVRKFKLPFNLYNGQKVFDSIKTYSLDQLFFK